VAVPTHFFKLITHPLKYGSVAFVIPNKEIVTSSTTKINNPKDAYYCNGGPCSLDNFIVNVKDLEKLAGIEFYPKLAPHYSVQVKHDINEILKRKMKKKESQF
jgi:DNA/RNA endonuclease G (NUC1)